MYNTDNVISFRQSKRPDDPMYTMLSLVIDRMIGKGIYPEGDRQEIRERVYRKLNKHPPRT